MKRKHPARIFITVSIFYLAITMLTSCALPEPVSYVDAQYAKNIYKRAAILVNRMGNITYQCPVPVSLKTDYANRALRPTDYMEGIPGLDVCIEDQSRIKESIPDYPYYRPYSHIFKYVQYYGNITPQLTDNVSKTLSSKGYHVMDVKKLAKDWPRPILEMTIQDIINNLQGMADILFVLHYTDKGAFKYDDIARQRECTGFTELCYTISIFDIQSKKRVLFEELNFFDPLSAISGDPALQSDPAFKNRIQGREGSTTNFFLSKNEILDLTMKYMRYGLVYRHNIDGTSSETVTIKGLEEIIP